MNAIIQSSTRTSLAPTTFGEAMQFAGMLAKSTLVPRDYQNKPENVLVAIQWGQEIGLSPLQAVQNLAVINGKPSVYGDALLGMVRAAPVCDDVIERFEGEGDKLTAICEARRRGKAPVIARFSVEDAKRANLWGKSGPWQQYPKRMLQMRARGFALRDAFPDVLRGVITVEEASDIPTDMFRGATIEADRAPVHAKAEDIPTLDDEPVGNRYPFTTSKFARECPTRDEWLSSWRKLIANCRAASAIDKLGVAMEMNEANFHAVQAFDPEAVDEVRGLLMDALTPPPAPEPPPASEADFPDAPPADDIPSMDDAAPAEPPPSAEPDKDREWTTRMLGEIAKARTNPRWWREKMPGKLARLEAERPELIAELEQAENDRAAELVMGAEA